MSPVDADTVVSHEQDGRVLSGVGVDAEDLAATMARHAPKDASAPDPAPTDAAPLVEKPKRGQARFDQLTGEREAERRRADAAEARAKELEAKLSAVQVP